MTAEHRTVEYEGVRLADEIRLLVDLVVEHAAPWLDGVVASGHGAQHPGNRPGQAQGCTWCPLCAVVALVAGERPELVARVLEQAVQLVALLRAVLADRWEPQEGVHMPGFQPRPRSRPATDAGGTNTRVQHIPVRPRQQWHG